MKGIDMDWDGEFSCHGKEQAQGSELALLYCAAVVDAFWKCAIKQSNLRINGSGCSGSSCAMMVGAVF